MKKLNRAWLISALSLMSGLSVALPGLSQPAVRLQSNPPLDRVVPDKEPVGLTLQAVDAAGQPLQNANLKLRLQTPAKTPWLTSDFPVVEGTTLLELGASAPQGELQFQQVMPIRGTYQLQVSVTPQKTGAFSPFQQTLPLSVPENPVKYRNVAILTVILLLAGFSGGWVIGGKQTLQLGEIAPQRVRLLLSSLTAVAIVALLSVNISAELAESTHAHGADTTSAIPAFQRSQGLEARLSGDFQFTVGQTAILAVQVTDIIRARPATDVVLNIQAIGLEDNELVFAYQGIPDATGRFTWQQQFFDGAPHQVVVEVAPQPNSGRQFSPFEVAREIAVEGVTPPLSVRFITLAYFTSIVALGLGVGLGLRLRWV